MNTTIEALYTLVNDHISTAPSYQENLRTLAKAKLAILRTCIHSREYRMGERFSRQMRQICAGILCVFQENLTKYGRKRLGQTVV